VSKLLHHPNIRCQAMQTLVAIFEKKRKAITALHTYGEHLEARDRALLHDMVFGVLRRFFSLEADISRFLKQKPDIEARMCLFIGAYQLRHMRIPSHAAVSECVDAIKVFQPKASGMVNAILRKLAQTEPPKKLKPHQRAELPKWLYAHWREAWGQACVQQFSEALQQAPALSLACFDDRQTWMDEAKAQSLDAQQGELSPYAVLLPSGTSVSTLPHFEEGGFTVMDQAAQAAVMALHAPKHGIILDICAAPGGKTSLLAQRFPDAHIIAIERYAQRMPRLQENLQRVSCPQVQIMQSDALCLPFADNSIDAIMLDAPCSASGIIRRHPDAKFLHSQEDVRALSQQQQQMLHESLRVLKPDGCLLYAVCSIHPEENEDVLQGLEVLSSQRLYPSLEHDGFFYACIQKTRRD